MAFVAAGATVAAGGMGLAGAFIQSGAMKDAAEKQAEAEKYAADLQKQMYEEQRADQEPWRKAGMSALGQMQNPYFQQNFSMADFQKDPGYQFRMDEGLKALQASAAARGGLMGGNLGTALTKYGQDYASNEYQNAYNRFTNNQSNRFNRLASLAGVGQTANAQLAQAGQNYANNVGNLATGLANAQGAAGIGQATVWGNALSGLGKNWMELSMMHKYGSQQPTLPGSGGSQYGTASSWNSDGAAPGLSQIANNPSYEGAVDLNY